LSEHLSLNEQILEPLKKTFVGKDEIIDLMGIALVGGENLFLLGPPGTAKSALVNALGKRLHGVTFDYLLTRFTEPNELFGPFDIRKLRDGDLVTNTEGMLPEADLVFLDELLNANSAILNSLLMVLNERVFRRGRETRQLPTLMVVGASNHLPEDESLAALFDRFLLRVRCDNVEHEQLEDVLRAGWELESASDTAGQVTTQQIRELQSSLANVDISTIRSDYVDLIQRLRHAGMAISDRRAVKYQRLVAASALLCGRMQAQPSDLWVLRYTWDVEEQREVLETLVNDWIAEQTAESAETDAHPRSRCKQEVDPEQLARDLERLQAALEGDVDPKNLGYLRDQVSILAGRCEWVTDSVPREQLQNRLQRLWDKLDT